MIKRLVSHDRLHDMKYGIEHGDLNDRQFHQFKTIQAMVVWAIAFQPIKPITFALHGGRSWWIETS